MPSSDLQVELIAGLEEGDIVTVGDSPTEYEVFIAPDGAYEFRVATKHAINRAKINAMLLDRLNQTLAQRWKRAD